jgi:hypothetical protein
VIRAARLVTTALLVGLSISLVVFAVTDWKLTDAQAYWNAALRLRDGGPLYPPIDDVNASTVYRYAPWFAFAAIPFTYLPPTAAGAAWSLILVAASAAAVQPLIRDREIVMAAFFASVLLGISAIGNAQPLIVAALVHGVERRSGPLWIAVTASLKGVPLAFALVYLGRRQWWRFGAAIMLTALLLAPMLAFDLSNYVTDASDAALLIRWPVLWGAVAIAASAITVLLARGRFGWLAAGATAALVLPRFFVYDITFLVPAFARPANRPVDAPERPPLA